MLKRYVIHEENLNNKYEGYLKKKEEYSKLDFGYRVLLNLCNENPKHTEDNIIYAKIWIIGRSYAAPIDRRKNKEGKISKNFYIDEVVPAIKNWGKNLDRKITKLNKYNCLNEQNIKEALELHKDLMSVFNELTDLNMRSLASKYLHFHCPKMFFIYDSIAKTEIQKLVNKNNKKSKFTEYDNIDPQYTDFCYRALALMNYVKETKPNEEGITPRDIDNILYKESHPIF